MTPQPEPKPSDEVVGRRLYQHQRALADWLDSVLDVEAGLHEILLQSRHNTAEDELDTILDVEAGLAAILPTDPPPSPPVQPDTSEADLDRAPLRQSLQPVGPQDRMALRADRNVAAAYQALIHDRGLLPARALLRNLSRVIVPVLRLARDLAHALTDDFDGASIALGLDPYRLEHIDLARKVALDLDEVDDSAPDFAGDMDRARNRIRAVVRYLGPGGAARALDSDGVLVRARAHARALALERALDLALEVERVRRQELADTRMRRFARRVVSDLVDIRIGEVQRAIGVALARRPPVLDKDSVQAFLDDFTAADLRRVDLAGIDLAGVRWSESGTLWPATVDVEDLKSRSEEIPERGGIWVVQSGAATLPGFAELR